MRQKTIVITGGTDGIGAAAARQLASLGHRVIVTGRSREKAERLAKEAGVRWFLADYTRLREVARLAAELREAGPIDVLCNNAGGIAAGRTLTEDGVEKTFQLNVLGGYLLTRLLADMLAQRRATVIQTSSIASNLFGRGFDIHDLNSEKNYTATGAYGSAKLADVLFTRELQRRFGSAGLSAVAFEPGVVRSSFGAGSTLLFRIGYHTPLKYLFTISPEKSAQRLVRLATGTPGEDFEPGGMYSGKKPYRVWCEDADGALARSLWEQCESLCRGYL